MMPCMVSGTPEDAQIEQGLGHFLDEERHAFGLVHERGQEFARQSLRPEHAAGHGRDLGLRQRLEI